MNARRPLLAGIRHTPFAGRATELRRLRRRLDELHAGQGGVVLLAGEPGIGKTRTLEEVVEIARARGALTLWGRCYEGEAARSFGPFAEALAEYARTTVPEVLRADLGAHAPSLLRLVPAIGEQLRDVPEPVALEPYEERVRLLDAVAQSLLAMATRVPAVLVLDDLHWADSGTVALLRHVARFAPRARLLVLGGYRDVEVAAHHPLTDALGALPRETSYEQLALGGLDPAAVKEVVDAVAEREVPAAWVEALARETSGNPFFLREVLLHLEEEGTFGAGNRGPVGPERLPLPDTVRQVITRRLGRLSQATNQLLQAAAGSTGGIDFEVAWRVAGLAEREALDALDAALAAQLLVSVSRHGQAYDFTHALVRHTLYEALSAARQVRLHRATAEVMEEVYGDQAAEHAATIARHYHRSAGLSGAERGVPHCLAAADQAERAAALGDVVDHIRAALDLLGHEDPRRPQLLGRLGFALAWAMRFDDAVAVACDAAAMMAEAGTRRATADYLAEVLVALGEAGGRLNVSPLVRKGLEYIDGRRDWTWAIFKAYEIWLREKGDPMGLPLDTPERHEAASLLAKRQWRGIVWNFAPWSSRAEVLAASGDPGSWLWTGEYRRGLSKIRELALAAEDRGRLGRAVPLWANVARLHIALGEFAEAEEVCRRAAALSRRLTEPSVGLLLLLNAEDDRRMALDEGWDAPIEQPGPSLNREAQAYFWAHPIILAGIARLLARTGSVEPAMQVLASVRPALERAPAWTDLYPRIACDAAEALWFTERTDHIEVIERNILEKVIAPDFRCPMVDGRLALARLCALQRRAGEAVEWFAEARAVLDEQGARPLRAIVDHDEALMYARRAGPGDRARAQPLIAAALQQFRALGMPGWIRRAVTLGDTLVTGSDTPAGAGSPTPPLAEADPAGVFRREGDVWAVTWAGRTVRLRDARGFAYLAVLLRNPDRELHATDVVRLAGGEQVDDGARGRPDRELATGADLGDAGTLLDARAQAAYRTRLAELREELAEAETLNDLGRIERRREEITALVQQLAGAARGRTAAAHGERARVTVSKGIKSSLDRIAASHPELGKHLAATIRRGYFCVYRPDPARAVRWDT